MTLHTSQPIKSLFDQFEDAVDLAAAADAAYTPAQIDAYAYNTVFQTGLFTDACHDWQCKALLTKLDHTSKLILLLPTKSCENCKSHLPKCRFPLHKPCSPRSNATATF
jgi:hypothetical protein